MLHHVVYLKYKRSYDQSIHRHSKTFCRNVMKEVSSVVSAHYGVNRFDKFSQPHLGKDFTHGYTHILASTFENARALVRYRASHAHTVFVPHLDAVIADFCICDFQTR